MPRPKLCVPSYRLHKPSGQACTYLNRERVYLGPYNSPESKRRFAELLATAHATPLPLHSADAQHAGPAAPATIAELLLRFIQEEFPRYARAERSCLTGAIRILREMFGETPAHEFGPLRLRMVRDAMIRGAKSRDLPPRSDGTPAKDRKPWSRSFSNKQLWPAPRFLIYVV